MSLREAEDKGYREILQPSSICWGRTGRGPEEHTTSPEAAAPQNHQTTYTVEHDTKSKLTLLKVVQVAEFHQVVAIVIVSDVDLGVFGQRVLHPGSFIATVVVVLPGLTNRGYSPVTVEDLPWKEQTEPSRLCRAGPDGLPAGTCSVQTGTTVVVGVVQQQHNGWSSSFRGCRGDSRSAAACSCHVRSGGGGGGGGATGGNGSCRGCNRWTGGGLHRFQDLFRSLMVFCGLMRGERLCRMI